MMAFVLTAIMINGSVIKVDTLVFQNLRHCLRNAEYNRVELLKAYDKVEIFCIERPFEKLPLQKVEK